MDVSEHLTGFRECDHDILVKIVRLAQWRKFKGTNGEWKDFVDVVNMSMQTGQTLRDPVNHTVAVLAAFVKTLNKPKDVEFVKRMREWAQHRESEKLLELTQPWPKSPEQHLVDVTLAHPRYKSFFDFPSWIEGWRCTSRGDINSPTRMVSIDCEMVVCEGDQKDVVRVCAVGSDCQKLIDELVLPSRRVLDYLTSITGVSEKDLEGVTITQTDAQNLVMDLLTPGTILVGHSVYNDLQALKIEHHRVIDTSLVFRDLNCPISRTPSLVNVCKAVLKYDFRETGKPHNCLDDAIVPMRIVQHWIEHGVGICILPPRVREVSEELASKLFLHSLPNYITVPDLKRLFHGIAPCEIQDIVFKNRATTGSTVAVFNSMNDADYAFEQLMGVFAVDSYGYPQKSICWLSRDGRSRAEVQVRKMVNAHSKVVLKGDDSRKRLPDNDMFEGEAMAAKRRKNNPAENSEVGELRTNKDNCMLDAVFRGGESRGRDMTKCSCTHFQELETTKLELAKVQKELRSRQKEIRALQRLLTALSRRESLA